MTGAARPAPLTIYADLDRAREAREAAGEEVYRLTEELRAVVSEAAAMGLPETVIAERAGVTRMTVRAWLGK